MDMATAGQTCGLGPQGLVEGRGPLRVSPGANSTCPWRLSPPHSLLRVRETGEHVPGSVVPPLSMLRGQGHSGFAEKLGHRQGREWWLCWDPPCAAILPGRASVSSHVHGLCSLPWPLWANSETAA